jgi:hypothetical protein
MPAHDEYGKKLLAEILGSRWSSTSPQRSIAWGPVRADLDGIIKTPDGKSALCAVEIEAKVYKQIRGAMLDLANHPAPKKLLVIIRAQKALGSEDKIRGHCEDVWKEIGYDNPGDFKLVVLKGTGKLQAPDADKELLVRGLCELGVIPS